MKQRILFIFAIILFAVLSACGPAQSAKAGKIAYVSAQYTEDSFPTSSDIYVVDDDGSNLTNLTNGEAYNRSPVWSPDGARIAFFSFQGGADGYIVRSDIYVMDFDGGNLTILTNDVALSELSGRPVWSPDGARIAFVAGPVDQEIRFANYDIFVVDADGGNLTQLTNKGVWPEGGLAWSPDGQQIVFLSWRESGSDIYVIDADGGNPTQLTNTTARTLVGFDSPIWSPDGQQIAFISHIEGSSDIYIFDINDADIYVMDADGSNLTRLTNTKTRVWSLAWSPDGQQIAFISLEDSSDLVAYAVDIYVMDADGGNLTRLTFNGVWPEGGLAWSPDGQQIAFLSEEGAGGIYDIYFEIYVMDADGANPTRLTFNGVWDPQSGFAWSP